MSADEACAPAPPQPDVRLRRALAALCVTEIVSWGVLYYAFPVLVGDLAADTGWSVTAVTGAFSAGALVSAVAGVPVGRMIDAGGPRMVMTAGSVLGVLAVVGVATAPTLPLFYAAWVLVGIAQAATLYPPAFTALTGWFQTDRVRALTVLTLVAGFSSTIFAPLTGWLLGRTDWRGTYLVLAAVLALVTIPLHATALTPPWRAVPRRRASPSPLERAAHEHGSAVLRSPRFVVLTLVMAAAGFGMYGATINIVGLLVGRGAGTGFASLVLGLCGAGQVLGRLCYGWLTARTRPRGRMAVILLAGSVTIGGLALVPGPAALVVVLAMLAGAARGLHTLLQASAVADRWGTLAFGRINGVFNAPITAAIALAPAGGVFIASATRGYPAAFALLALTTAAAALAGVACADPLRPAGRAAAESRAGTERRG